ncbi:hypothetical protein [Dickeya sp. NCPPB 3274]|uniref:hypothetical protein n=1 Tax=Dickeya sp. NCPPB 3274 TaxID=568766 RepID=UPI0012684311|nr:hypothetical protein [Dickeya sp. NCPPB 3274]
MMMQCLAFSLSSLFICSTVFVGSASAAPLDSLPPFLSERMLFIKEKALFFFPGWHTSLSELLACPSRDEGYSATPSNASGNATGDVRTQTELTGQTRAVSAYFLSPVMI